MRSFLTPVLLLATISASAQPAAAPATSPVPDFQKLQGHLGTQAGDYNFTSYDKGRLQEVALNQAINMQQQDREYILVQSAAIETAMNGFITVTINGPQGLPTLVIESMQNGKEIPLGALLRAQQQFELGKQLLQNKIATIKALPGSVNKDEPISLEGSGIVKLRTGGQVDLSDNIKFYTDQLNTYQQTFYATRVTTTLPNRKPLVNVPLSGVMEEVKSTPPLTQAEVNELTSEEMRKRTVSTDKIQILNNHRRRLLSLVMQYVNDYGKNQKWRANTTPEERQKTLAEIYDAFWSASLLRASYGVKNGAIGIVFNTKAFNAEEVFSSNQIQFLSEPVTDQAQINSQRRLLLVALGVMDKRDDAILAAETPFFNKVLSGLTFIKGESQLASVNVEILKLLYADMFEESVLSTEGYTGMRRHYAQRWYTDDATKATVRERAQDWENADTMDLKTARGTFLAAFKTLQGYTALLDEADQIKAKINAFQNNSPTMGKYKKNIDDL